MAELKERTMKKEFLPYDLEVKLVELGFNEKTFDVHSDIVTSGFKIVKKPTPRILFQQAYRFFREQLLLDSCIIPYWFIDGEYKVKKYTYSIEPSNRFDEYFDCDSDEYDTYKEAEIACLVKLIEICRKLK